MPGGAVRIRNGVGEEVALLSDWRAAGTVGPGSGSSPEQRTGSSESTPLPNGPSSRDPGANERRCLKESYAGVALSPVASGMVRIADGVRVLNSPRTCLLRLAGRAADGVLAGRRDPPTPHVAIRGHHEKSSNGDTMSRDYRDKRGGHSTRWHWTAGSSFVKYAKRRARKSARQQAKADLRRGNEPAPIYPIEREYID